MSMRVGGESIKLDGWEVEEDLGGVGDGDKYDPNVLYEIIKN